MTQAAFSPWRRLPRRFWPTAPGLALLLILAVAAALRFHGIDWDAGHGFHPDERSFYLRAGCMYDLLAQAPGFESCHAGFPQTESGFPGLGVLLDPERSPLNPHWFPLGSSLIYVLTVIRLAIEPFTDLDSLDLRYAGRTLSALADVGSVFLVYVLGRRMFGRNAGLLAAGLVALSVIHIQNSHFYRPETFSVCFILLSFWGMLRLLDRRRLRDSLLLGALVGLAMAPKVSVLPLLVPLGVTYGCWLLDSAGGRWSGVTMTLVRRLLFHGALAGLTALAVFFALAPYALLDFGTFIDDLSAQANMASHAGLWPFTIQYVDTPAFLYQMRQSIVWGLGIPLGVAAWVSIPFTAVMAWRYRTTRRWDLLLLGWVVPQLLFLEYFEVRFLRYVFPLMPVMVLLAARMLLWLVEYSRDWRSRGGAIPGRQGLAGIASRRLRALAPALALALLGLALLSTAFYSVAFQKVYAGEHPAVQASKWAARNIPAGSSVVSDNHWDEFIPGLYSSSVWQFPAYEPDNREKMTVLAERLSQADYLVFYSQRPYVSVSRDPERFPFTIGYYRQLFQGDLGFRLEQSFTVYPRFMGVSFEDSGFAYAGMPPPEGLPSGSAPVALHLGYADDNVVGYDHPLTLVFRNVERLPQDRLAAMLLAGPDVAQPTDETGLMLSEDAKKRQRAGGTWPELFDRDGWANRWPVLAWLLAVELIFVVTLPLAMFVFKPLPDRGIMLARILGFLAVAYVAWLVVSLGWLEFSRAAIGVGLLAVAGLSLAVLAFRRREIVGFLTQHWRLLVWGELLFLGAFLLFALVRAENPDLWHPYRGGEKPMELAYLTAVVRSTVMPPYDPWFAGGYLNYYYWGYFILAVPIRLTGIIPATAFNLAVPLLFALTVTGAYSIAYNLAASVSRGRGSAPDGAEPAIEPAIEPAMVEPESSEKSGDTAGSGRSFLRRTLQSPVCAGLVAAALLAGAGNLDGGVQVAQGTWSWINGGEFGPFDYWRSSRAIPTLDALDPAPLAFWLPDPVAGHVESTPHITEFPFFTFLFADLHAHMIVIPFTLLVIGLGAALTLGVSGHNNPGGRFRLASIGLALGISLGALLAINSWDYPTYALLTLAFFGLAAVSISKGLPRPQAARRAAGLLLLGGAAVAVSYLAFLPFHQYYETFDPGADVSKWATPLPNYLAIHGVFVFVAVTFLLVQLWQPARSAWRNLARPAGGGTGLKVPAARRLGLPAALIVVLAAALYVALAGFVTAAVLGLLLAGTCLAGWRALNSGDEATRRMSIPLLLLAMALAVGLGVDFVRVGGDIGRMNTLFKLYLEVWVLFSLASGFMLWHLAAQSVRPEGPEGLVRVRVWLKAAWAAALLVLVLAAAVYPALGTQARWDDRWIDGGLTLDGTAYMRQAEHVEEDQRLSLAGDLEGIRWLQDNVEGTPVVLEAHHNQYHWNSRIAGYTGLPTVLGWPWHQIQQRGPYAGEVRQRARDVAAIYDTPDLEEARDLLARYEVEYVVVGELERAHYSATGLDKFARLVEQGEAALAFEGRTVQIFRISVPESN